MRVNPRWIVAASLSCTAVCALAWSPFGPSNYEDCVDEASKRPTGEGVKLAKHQCYLKFVKPEEERQAAEAERKADAFAATWAKVITSASTLAQAKRALGEPSSSIVENCAVTSDAGRLPSSCLSHEWPDRRRISRCDRWTAGSVVCKSFKLQTYVDPKGVEVVWAYWSEPH